MAGVRLKRLKIDKYRNVAPGTELVFNDKFNVLLGKNGTGKTTLLRLIAMVVTGRFAILKDEVFEIEYELSFGELVVTVRLRNAPAPRQETPFALASPAEPQWSYEIRIRTSQEYDWGGRWTISASPLGARLQTGTDPQIEETVPIWSPYDADVVLRALLHLYASLRQLDDRDAVLPIVAAAFQVQLRSINNIGRFDEALEAFCAITGERTERATGGVSPVYYSVGTLGGVAFPTSYDFIPEQIVRATSTVRFQDGATNDLKFMAGDLPFLGRFVGLAGLLGVEIVLKLASSGASAGGDRFLDFAGCDFMIRVDEATTISHDLLSNGQKRLLSFLYYAAANPDIVIADELANGMHHDWVQACVDEISDRQSFLASQDPLLFDFLTFDSAEEVQKSFILCTLEKRDGRGQFVWKNLDPESAASFYRAYDAGIQHVSEILRTKGLW